jgi:hypothetical protein
MKTPIDMYVSGAADRSENHKDLFLYTSCGGYKFGWSEVDRKERGVSCDKPTIGIEPD